MEEKIKKLRERLDQLLSKPKMTKEEAKETIDIINALDKKGWVSNDEN